VFGIVVVIVFQSVFCLEMYQNIFFNFFDISASKRSKNIKKIHLQQKKIIFKGQLCRNTKPADLVASSFKKRHIVLCSGIKIQDIVNNI
jgi:hypothetical protein